MCNSFFLYVVHVQQSLILLSHFLREANSIVYEGKKEIQVIIGYILGDVIL